MPTVRADEEVRASPRVRDEWLQRVEAEYRSCAAAQHLTLWLIQIGASPDLISAGLSIAADELLHAGLSHQVFVAAGGGGAPNIPRSGLRLLRPYGEEEPLEHDVLRSGVEIFCLNETVAVPLFKELRQTTRVPLARRTLDQVLRDEVRHRDFGWTLLDWLLGLALAPTLRAILETELPAMFARLRDSYVQPSDAVEAEMEDDERAWGLMPSAAYSEVLQRTVERDYVPRFARLGIDARAAWRYPT